ncbi:MAG: CapA family protein [Sphaerochaetaceae bacterium]
MSKDSIKIVIGGDFAPLNQVQPRSHFGKELQNVFKDTDYTIINLEAPLTLSSKKIIKTGRNFRIDPAYAEILKNSGVDCVTLANNHIRDFGNVGVVDTLGACSAAGLDYIGAGTNSVTASEPLIKDINGIKIAFFNYCEREFSIASNKKAGANPFDLIDAYHQITSLRESVDKIIVIYHGGLEYIHYPTPEMVRYFRFLIDIGADAIVAHHSHWYSGYEIYKGRPICYSLGNLYFSLKMSKGSREWLTGLCAILSICGNVVNVDLLPVLRTTEAREFGSVEKMRGEEKDIVLKDVRNISAIIENQDEFFSIWTDYYKSSKYEFYRSMLAGNRFLRRLLKRMPLLDSLEPSTSKKYIWLNNFRCESHLHKAISIIERDLEQRGV